MRRATVPTSLWVLLVSPLQAQRVALDAGNIAVRPLTPIPPLEALQRAVPFGEGRFLLLSSTTRTVAVIGLAGAPSGPLLRLGHDPRSPSDPQDLFAREANGVVILDGRTGRLVEFSYDPKGRWIITGEHRLSVEGASAACGMPNGDSYVLAMGGGAGADGILHRVSSDSRMSVAFGGPFGDPSRLGDFSYGFGRLACIPDRNTVVAASRLLPEVRAYRSDGRLLWVSRLTPFRRITTQETEPGTVLYTYASDSLWNETVGAYSLSTEFLVVQARRRFGKAGASRGTDTWLLRLADGLPLSHQRDVPRVWAVNRSVALVESGDGGLGFVLKRIGIRP